jgi:hypothetical protein
VLLRLNFDFPCIFVWLSSVICLELKVLKIDFDVKHAF